VGFALDSDTRRALGYHVIDVIDDYFESLPHRGVQRSLQDRATRVPSATMPENGEAPSSVLADVCHELLENGFHTPSANYFGLANPTPAYMAVLAEALVAATNPQLASIARSRITSGIERETGDWLCNRIGWQRPFCGTFTTGGTEGNLSALAVALNARFPDISELGLLSIEGSPVFYASAEAHHSLEKSASVLGIGRRALRRIPVDGSLRIDLNKLEQQIQTDLASGKLPFCVVSTAGTTSSGAIDDLAAIDKLCRQYDLWHHCDGAYGAALILSDSRRHLLKGIELTDSVVIDPHKWLAMPFSTSVLLTRHPKLLEQTFSVYPPYLQSDTAEVDNYKTSLQWTRRMNSLKLWVTLRVHGRKSFEDLFAAQSALASRLVDKIRLSRQVELLNSPVLPILNLRVISPGLEEREIAAVHEAIVAQLVADGKYWISTTVVSGRSVIRLMVISYLTEPRHVDGLWEQLQQAIEANLSRATPASLHMSA
jgi:aromatic-L-amino-acid decarboxylase